MGHGETLESASFIGGHGAYRSARTLLVCLASLFRLFDHLAGILSMRERSHDRIGAVKGLVGHTQSRGDFDRVESYRMLRIMRRHFCERCAG